MLRYLSGLVTSTFTVGTSGCDGSGGRGGWDPSGCRCGYGGCFPVIFALYLNDLTCEAISSTPSISSL